LGFKSTGNFVLQTCPCSFLYLRIGPWGKLFILLLCFFSPCRLLLSFPTSSTASSLSTPSLSPPPLGSAQAGSSARLGRPRRRALGARLQERTSAVWAAGGARVSARARPKRRASGSRSGGRGCGSGAGLSGRGLAGVQVRRPARGAAWCEQASGGQDGRCVGERRHARWLAAARGRRRAAARPRGRRARGCCAGRQRCGGGSARRAGERKRVWRACKGAARSKRSRPRTSGRRVQD
jgi:hypothetical protein